MISLYWSWKISLYVFTDVDTRDYGIGRWMFLQLPIEHCCADVKRVSAVSSVKHMSCAVHSSESLMASLPQAVIALGSVQFLFSPHTSSSLTHHQNTSLSQWPPCSNTKPKECLPTSSHLSAPSVYPNTRQKLAATSTISLISSTLKLSPRALIVAAMILFPRE